ncbi:polyprenyl synthetase family protein [Streptomyces fulvorobeus]|uniref:Geranylgeranyl diphosphate synthase type I n=1 Tax=Streptomyces fulvorobeus TaxID=284028 RepID=A0A7J0C0B0_9ACTN|nr:polyprenyl synthetase family protein [Streptomyces fulvorobeus]NYE39257.1 geranylgeranyl diphosphate synthase type I [Streptomyces fulvorobeus]GFM95467.1 geranylgeranyl pyrophosphate synthase [Streptomyces fulvorobeus]
MLDTRTTRAGTAAVDGPGGAPYGAGDATAAVDGVLAEHLGARLVEAAEVDGLFAQEVAGRVAELVQRGGKRLRTAFLWCGWRAAGGTGSPRTLLRLAAALELLQACALVHDDVMDGSPVRRGAPAVHTDFARVHRARGMRGSPDAYGAAAAVLAGDLALAWADDLLTETVLSSPHGHRLHREWQAMRTEMVAGQYRDIHAQAAGSSGTEEALKVATLKSALYTVARPLALGASLAGADAGTVEALRSAGRCAGLAFQLRDDLLGAFGDPAVTGKPAGEDLRGRKLTYLLAVASELAAAGHDEEAVAALGPDAFQPGTPARSEDAVDRMRAALERTGATAVVEARITELAAMSLRQFGVTGADHQVRREFASLVERAVGAAPEHDKENLCAQ